MCEEQLRTSNRRLLKPPERSLSWCDRPPEGQFWRVEEFLFVRRRRFRSNDLFLIVCVIFVCEGVFNLLVRRNLPVIFCDDLFFVGSSKSKGR